MAVILLFVASAVAAHEHDEGRFAGTRYPIVLVHGFMGFSSILGVDYFYQVPADLRRNGATVYLAEVSQVNSSAVRGEQLLKQLKQWAARDGIRKFNLIGHSQGGPTARYVAGVAPEMVASILTVASPTTLQGSGNNADLVQQLLTNYPDSTSLFGSFVALMSGHPFLPQDAPASAALVAELNDFAVRFPAGVPTSSCGEGQYYANGMYLFSATGNQPKTNPWDPTDLLMAASSVAGDGIIPVCSAHFGKVLRDDYPWNHFDEMNHLFGLIGTGAPDPVTFYRQHANRLKLLGL